MGFPSDGSVLPLRSEAVTITYRPREKLNHTANQGCPQAPPPEAWAPGSEGTLACLRAQPARGSARRGALSCPGDGGARTRGHE